MINDLETPIARHHPEIDQMKAALRRAGAAAAVLDDDAERDARIVGRRERDEQAVVAQALVDVLLTVLLVLRDADDLRGAGLARNSVLHTLHLRARRTARLRRHADHGVTHELPMFRRVVLDARQRDRLDPAHFAGEPVLRATQQTRRETRTSRGERRACARKLNRGHEHVALTDPGDHRLAGKPHLVFAAREIVLLPCRRRHDSALLADDVVIEQRDLQRVEMAVGLGPSKSKDFATSLGPELVTPGVVYLCTEDAPNGVVLQAQGGRFSIACIVENQGVDLGAEATVEDVASRISA